MMSFLHSLLILNDVKDNQIVDKHINEICPKPGPELPWTDLCGIYFVFKIWEVVVRFVDGLGLVDDGWRHFFSYVVVVSFIGWGNLSALRKPPTFRE